MDARSERRLVTCLFIDVVGSTDATVRLGPERMQRLLRDAFAEMSATINQYGGTIETYVGDAIFVIFGAKALGCIGISELLRFRPTPNAKALNESQPVPGIPVTFPSRSVPVWA